MIDVGGLQITLTTKEVTSRTPEILQVLPRRDAQLRQPPGGEPGLAPLLTGLGQGHFGIDQSLSRCSLLELIRPGPMSAKLALEGLRGVKCWRKRAGQFERERKPTNCQ